MGLTEREARAKRKKEAEERKKLEVEEAQEDTTQDGAHIVMSLGESTDTEGS